ncbi:uncharacterized protein PHACADRAFT_259862, partial [Phanerochaete carnosa HHB-10118-sp]
MSYISRWRRGLGDLGSRRTQRSTSSYDPLPEGRTDDDLHAHHEKQQERKAKAHPALLPLPPALSTFTWSDLRSNNTSADSSAGATSDDDGLDTADTYSFPTDAATLSHTTSHRSNSSRPSGAKPEPRTFGVAGPSAAGRALPPASTAVNSRTQAPRDPHTKRSLTPPGLSSKASSVAPGSYPDYIHPDVLFADPGGDKALAADPHPRVSLPHAASATYSDNPGIDMDPMKPPPANPPHPQTKSSLSRSLSRPGSLQLPSPPDSPPLPAGLPPSSSSSSHRSHTHRRPPSHVPSLSIGVSGSGSTGTRPPLGSTRSAPISATLPFRPPPTSGSRSATSASAWWSSTASPARPSTLSPPHSPPRASLQQQQQQQHAASAGSRASSPPLLTQAFRAPLQRSPSQSTTTTTTTTTSNTTHTPLTASPAPMDEGGSSSR